MLCFQEEKLKLFIIVIVVILLLVNGEGEGWCSFKIYCCDKRISFWSIAISCNRRSKLVCYAIRCSTLYKTLYHMIFCTNYIHAKYVAGLRKMCSVVEIKICYQLQKNL